MKFFRRYRQWLFSATPMRFRWLAWIAVFLALITGYGVAFLTSSPPKIIPPPPRETVCAQEREQILEYQHRSEIKEQALQKLNEVSGNFRERYRFLLGLLNTEAQRPDKTNEKKKDDKNKINLRHFSIQSLQNGDYQYQILLNSNVHKVDTEYGLVFDFDQGDDTHIIIDSSGFSPLGDKTIVLPFLGVIRSDSRQLQISKFYVRHSGKNIFEIKNKFPPP